MSGKKNFDPNKMSLVEPQFLKRLEMLYLLARKVLSGNLKADRKSTKKGSGILFADHSEYSLGDDLRSIDWNIYARMEELVVKLYEVEEDTSIYILLDTSCSMMTKALYARQLTASLGYIALNNADRLTVYGFGDTLESIVEPCHGKGKIFPMLHALGQAKCAGKASRFSACMKTFQSRHKRRGVCVVISDFFMPNGYSDGLKQLQWSKHDVFCLQTLDKNELGCDWKGDIDLECMESGAHRQITVGQREIARYVEAIKNWNELLRVECVKRQIGYSSTTTDVPFEEIIQYILRKGGLVT